MSEPESRTADDDAAGVRLASCAADVVEIAAWRGRAGDLGHIVSSRGARLSAQGRVVLEADRAALSVRPGRWLLLTPPAAPGACAVSWQAACAGVGSAVDLSSGLTALYLEGRAVREMLARGCRLDLNPDEFPSGRAAATIIAQVSVILAATPAGMLLLTAASTARHLSEWLASSAAPFGFAQHAAARLSLLSGGPRS